ncbi:MAG: DUF255 domain-containing protein [Chitinophagales bacterium]|nr:DUF255 domain-containing protein [Chitinophagales bacterium]MDW8417944.1 DUF255 domain-containing protein [Chitinophagales bacterium]
MKRLFLVAVLLPLVIANTSFLSSPGGIKWITWEQMQQLQKVQPRKVIIDVYTDWCGWCKRMDATTFSHPEIIRFINENYYAIKFDAESREKIRFKGKEYGFVSSGYRGYHQLAAEILGGQMSYPTTVYLDEKQDVIFPVPGYLNASQMESVLHYIHSNSYKTMGFEQFRIGFRGKVQ